jgi:hypothetical protein
MVSYPPRTSEGYTRAFLVYLARTEEQNYSDDRADAITKNKEKTMHIKQNEATAVSYTRCLASAQRIEKAGEQQYCITDCT